MVYICNKHIKRFFTLSFNIQARDAKEIQPHTRFDHRKLVKIPEPAWADTFGIAPKSKSFQPQSNSRDEFYFFHQFQLLSFESTNNSVAKQQ